MSEIDQLLDVLNRMVTGDAATLELVKLVRDRHDDDIAELRDELHALANRVETLTRARLTEPAEVGAKMVDYDSPVRDTRGDVRAEHEGMTPAEAAEKWRNRP